MTHISKFNPPHHTYTILFTLIFALLCASCAEKPVCQPNAFTTHGGFLDGLIHGLCLPFAILGNMLGMADSGLYALQNDGFLYWLGYLLGFGIWASKK